MLKGAYVPAAFRDKPPTGYLDPLHASFFADLDAGDTVFLFYLRPAHPSGRLGRPDIGVIVQGGRVVYPRDSEATPDNTYNLAEFERVLTSLVGPSQDRWRIAGPWKLLLPAGFQRDVTFTQIDANRFLLEPKGIAFSGVYEVRDNRLLRVPADGEHSPIYGWKLMSRHLAHLDEQPTKSRPANYDGAVLFRVKSDVIEHK